MKIVINLMLLPLFIACATPRQTFDAASSTFKNEPSGGAMMIIHAVENDGESIEVNFTLRNTYPFSIQVPPSAVSMDYNGQMPSRSIDANPLWVIAPGNAVSGQIVNDFEPKVLRHGTLKISVGGITQASDVSYSHAEGTTSTSGVFSAHTNQNTSIMGSQFAVQKSKAAGISSKPGANLPPINAIVTISNSK